MMRRILALVLMMAFPFSARAEGTATKSRTGHKRLDEMRTTPDKWDELMSAEPLPDDKPARQTYTAPTRAPARVPARKAASIRAPASVAPLAPRAPAAAVFPTANMSFEEYVAQNARNPALSMRVADHQKAFADTSAPAVITIPNSDSTTPSTAAAPAAGVTGSQQSAIQAAAAAAGITLPPGVGGAAAATPVPGPAR